MGTGDVSPVSCYWSSCGSGLGWCEYSVAAVDELSWPALLKQAASIWIANAFLCSEGIHSMSYICFVVHNVAECLLQESMVLVTTGVA